MNFEEAKKELMKLQKKMSAYAHAVSLMYYDGATTAPKGTAENRSISLSILSEEMYLISTSKETVELLEYLDSCIHPAEGASCPDGFDPDSEDGHKLSRMVYLLLKDIRNMQKIPMEEYVNYQKLVVESQAVWHKAKETSDFALFEPYLEQMFATQIRFAHYADPNADAYDYWLNEYEPGISRQVCDQFFARLKERLVPLIHQVSQKPQVSNACIKGHFDTAAQDQLSHYLMEMIGLDTEHVGLSTTEHPFTTSLGSHLDERITTHYYEDDYIAIVKDISKNEYWQGYFKPLAVEQIFNWFNENKEAIYYEIQYIRNTKNGKKGEIKEKGYKIENISYKIIDNKK